MTRRQPKRYTVLVSRTGEQPIVFSFRPTIALLTLLLGVGLPIATIVTLLFIYADRNSQLAQRNSQLTQEANTILNRLELLEDKVGTLRDRSGDQSARNQLVLPQSDVQSDMQSDTQLDAQPDVQSEDRPDDRSELVPLQINNPTLTARSARFEFSAQAEPEVILSAAEAKIPNLLQLLQTDSEPLTEQDLMRDAARPRGVPILGNAEVSSPFGLQPGSSGWGYELHQGVDFTANYGSLVQATAPGVIEEAGWDDRFGNRVVIDHGYGYRTLYAHLSELTVSAGASIKRNQVIGYLGNSGRSNAPHLHYGVYRNGFVVDPEDYLN